MKFKIGDLIIRDSGGLLAIVVNTDRQMRGIIKVQFYGGCPVTGEAWHSEWSDQMAVNWRLQ